MKSSHHHPSPLQAKVTSGGTVTPDAIYRLDEIKSRMGWRDAAFRAAVRAGLKTHRSGKRLYVLGSDLIAFVTRAKGGDR